MVASLTLLPSLLKIITAILPTPPYAPVTIPSFTFSPHNQISLVCLVVNAHWIAVKPAVPNIIA